MSNTIAKNYKPGSKESLKEIERAAQEFYASLENDPLVNEFMKAWGIKDSILVKPDEKLGFSPSNTQGLLVNGYGRSLARHFVYTVPKGKKKQALDLLRDLATPRLGNLRITDANRLKQKGRFTRSTGEVVDLRMQENELEYELNVALTFQGMQELLGEHKAKDFFTVYDDAFVQGPLRPVINHHFNRLPDSPAERKEFAKLIQRGNYVLASDTIGDRGVSAPDKWLKGFRWQSNGEGKTTPPVVHAIFSLYANTYKEMDGFQERLDKLIANYESPFENLKDANGKAMTYLNGQTFIESNDLYHDKSITPPFGVVADLDEEKLKKVKAGENDGYIHFKYKDGISQPRIAHWTSHEFEDGGQGDVNADDILRIDPQKKWLRDCSFAAFRVLKQDTTAFEKYLEEHADELKPKEGKEKSKEHYKELLAAKMVGRWRNGNPLILFPNEMGERLQVSDLDNYLYEYKVNGKGGEDPNGTVCPFSAHMRRSNPRDTFLIGGVQYKTHHRRIMRRAQPYGTTKEGQERGLTGYFIAPFLDHTFEFVMKAWVNESELFSVKAQNGEVDPLLGYKGDAQGADKFTIPLEKTSNGKCKVMKHLPQFITTRAGAYVFFPSIEMLKNQFKIN